MFMKSGHISTYNLGVEYNEMNYAGGGRVDPYPADQNYSPLQSQKAVSAYS